MMKKVIQPYLDQTIKDLFPQAAHLLPAPIEYPENPQFGDLSSPVAMHLAGPLGQPPRQIASQIVDKLNSQNLNQMVNRITIDGPGFINIRLRSQFLLEQAYGLAKPWSKHPQSPGAGQTVLVEFSSPNIAKPFNVGHLRSTIIGDSVARMYRYLGFDVLADNHLGDWGTQYGKLAVAVEKWGNWTEIEADPIRQLFDLYVKFHTQEEHQPELTEEGRQYFKRLEQGDQAAIEMWQQLVKVSLVDFNQIYQQLDVSFDLMLGESFFASMGEEVIQECLDKGIAKQSQGALLIFFPNDELPPLMIRKSDGTSLYATRDLAAIKYRFAKYHLDRLVYEVGNEQELAFRQLFRAAELLGYVKHGQLVHVGHGLFMLPTGKMSTRKGQTIWIRDLISELRDKAVQIVKSKSPDLEPAAVQQIAQTIAIGALKYNDLSQNRNSVVVFDKEKSLSLEGNSAPYLQYSVARCRSILHKANSQQVVIDPDQLRNESSQRSDEPTASERSLASWLNRYNEVVAQAADEYLPSLVASYLFILAQRFSVFYQADPVLTATPAVRSSRLMLVLATCNVLTSGLELLGIQVPPRM